MSAPVRKRLRRLRQQLVNSRYALERTSTQGLAAWLGDLLFMMSCRRVIMLNELDRELGELHMPLKPGTKAADPFKGAVAAAGSPEEFVRVCEEQETYLVRALENLNMEPGLHGHTRNAIANLLSETKANLKDIGFLRQHHPALQG